MCSRSGINASSHKVKPESPCPLIPAQAGIQDRALGACRPVSPLARGRAENGTHPVWSNVIRAAAGTLALGVLLCGCSDIYYDRRETIALGANDAVETNKVTHMVDPWPRHSANRDIAFNGNRMQAAAERYRTGRIIQPVNVTTSSAAYQQAQQAAAAASATAPVSGQPAAPVK